MGKGGKTSSPCVSNCARRAALPVSPVAVLDGAGGAGAILGCLGRMTGALGLLPIWLIFSDDTLCATNFFWAKGDPSWGGSTALARWMGTGCCCCCTLTVC